MEKTKSLNNANTCNGYYPPGVPLATGTLPNSQNEKKSLTMAIGFKVIEELGELFNEILINKGYQKERKDRLDKLNEENIKKEFADVIITVLMLAKRFDINIKEAIKIKMDELKERGYGDKNE